MSRVDSRARGRIPPGDSNIMGVGPPWRQKHVPALIALLFALVIAAFFVSRRVGMIMLAGASVAVAAMFAWTWHSGPGVEIQRGAIPVEQVTIVDVRRRGNTTDYLIRNGNERWTLTAIQVEKVAQGENGEIADRREFSHRVEVPPEEERWQTLRFFGLEIGLDYELRVIGTEGSRRR
jgi:hypothetical protein